MQTVAVDILGPFPDSPSGNRYILAAMDYFTRWAEAYAIPNQEAATVADKLVSNFFLRFSPPEQLHSDQGRQFESTLLKEICHSLGIHKTRTTPYHPQGDGLVERFNRTLLSMLATTTRDHPATWETLLPKLCLAYNVLRRVDKDCPVAISDFSEGECVMPDTADPASSQSDNTAAIVGGIVAIAVVLIIAATTGIVLVVALVMKYRRGNFSIKKIEE